ncbi:MAG: glycosyltransferase [Microscillaceae bacterium]|nr:glycosyltransferase [Microscillaceae bacterium]MDW8460642.1 glycosyltransferase family 2 protein [Cytophagales bacterium]
MQNFPKISVIIVTYNAEKYLEQAILSVIGQNYPNLELIIIDGKSTDGTVEIIKKYEQHITYWVSEPDKGIYDAMNKGIDKATGEWLYFLGADDMLCERILCDIFQGNPYKDIDFLYGDVLLKHSKQIIYGKKDIHTILFSTICHQACFYKRYLFNQLKKYEIHYQYIADWIFNIKVMLNTIPKKTLRYLHKTIAIYNEAGTSSSNKIGEEIKKLHYDILTTLKINSFYRWLLVGKPTKVITNNFDFTKIGIDSVLFIQTLFKIRLKQENNYFKKIILSLFYVWHKPSKPIAEYKVLIGEVLFPKLYNLFKIIKIK